MTAYRRVLAVMVVLTAALALVLPFLRTEQTTLVLETVLLLVVVFAVISELYLLALTWTSTTRPRSWVLVLLATTGLQVTIGVLLVAVVAVVNVAGLRLLPGVSLTLIGMGLVICGSAVITKAAVIWLSERHGEAIHNRRSTDL